MHTKTYEELRESITLRGKIKILLHGPAAPLQMKAWVGAIVRYKDGHDDCRELGLLRGKADFSDLPLPSRSVVLTDLLPKTTCRCDIKDLMSTGHTPTCPEKKQ